LKDYIIKGYALNDKRLEALQKTVEIQAKMLATAIEGDSDEVLKAVTLYTNQMTSELRRNRARLKEYWLLYIRMYLEEKFILLWRKKTS